MGIHQMEIQMTKQSSTFSEKRNHMTRPQWREFVLSTLQGAGAAIEALPSGAMRISHRGDYFVLLDAADMTSGEVYRIANGGRT